MAEPSLESLVAGALGEALAESPDAAGSPDLPSGRQMEQERGAPSAPGALASGQAPAEDSSAVDLAARIAGASPAVLRPNETGNTAAEEVRSAQVLGRTFARRDPIAGQDPLPLGRDWVTLSSAAVSTGNDLGENAPELVAFRASEDFPGSDRSAPGPRPGRAVGRVTDLPAALTWPAAPPVEVDAIARMFDAGIPGLRADAVPGLGGAEDIPVWLAPPADSQAEPGWLVPATPSSASDGVRPGESGAAGVSRPDRAGLSGVRADFPILAQRVHGNRLVWLDNGATTQKPRSVIKALADFYENDNSNVHRGAHTLAARATDAYEGARLKVARYLGASDAREVVFVRGATEAINLVAQSWGRRAIGPGDEILVSHLEHHANIVPWQQLADERGARLRVIPVDDKGDIRLDAYEALLSPKARIVAITQVANTIGTVVPVTEMAAMAHLSGARVLVDGAQSVAHLPVDVQSLGADFFVFSGHKVYAPTGIGVLWARSGLLESMPPWQGGGSMIRDVTFERTIYAEPPAKFEAGTPSLGDAVGLGAALDYVETHGRAAIAAWEHGLVEQMVAQLQRIDGLTIVGAPASRAANVSFVMEQCSPSEIASHLDRCGIAVRAGHHCAQPILRRFGHEETVRASVAIYNTLEDIARLCDALAELA